MTKEETLKSYLEDDFLVERNYLEPGKAEKIAFSEDTNSKMVEVIKLAINGAIDGDSEGVIVRRITQFLNK
ncbi:MAG: hypothetical protein ACK5OS_05460 [Chryseotalea sp.]|jgi:hypothetical protein